MLNFDWFKLWFAILFPSGSGPAVYMILVVGLIGSQDPGFSFKGSEVPGSAVVGCYTYLYSYNAKTHDVFPTSIDLQLVKL